MFLHDTHLPQLLTPEEYTSPAQLEREMERLFLPVWHLVASTDDLPRDGDYLTIELYGRPLIVWNSGGEIQTFLNVCPHRFSRLRTDGCGNVGDRLKCQYHGWEFDCEGHTRKIPDARSFRPMTQGALALTRFHTETCGKLVFVSFSDDPRPLAEFLGPGYEVGQRLCGDDRRTVHTLDIAVEANWKTKIENALESYHVGLIHPTTFGQSPDAEKCFHEMQPLWTTFTTPSEGKNAADRFLDRLIHRLARVEYDGEYKHYHYYPHIMYGRLSLFSWCEMIFPVSPTRMRIRTIMFCYRGRSGSLRGRLLSRALSRWQIGFLTKVAHEDAGILPEVQRGLASPLQPSRGVISVREERCFHFQEYIRRMTASDAPLPHAAPVAAAT